YSSWKRVRFATSARVFSLGKSPSTVVVGAITEWPSYARNWSNTKIAVRILVYVANLIEMKGCQLKLPRELNWFKRFNKKYLELRDGCMQLIHLLLGDFLRQIHDRVS